MTEYQQLVRETRQLRKELWARHNPSPVYYIDDYGCPIGRPEENFIDTEKFAGSLPENRYA